MWVWIWVLSTTGLALRRKAPPPSRDRPVILLAQGQPFADRRLVDLDDLDAGGFQVGHLVANGQANLQGRTARGSRLPAGKDQHGMVHGPVSMPFTGLSVRLWASFVPPKGHGGRTVDVTG